MAAAGWEPSEESNFSHLGKLGKVSPTIRSWHWTSVGTQAEDNRGTFYTEVRVKSKPM